MHAADIDGFFADPTTLDRSAHLILHFYFECSGDPIAAAAHFCSEQSTAQWHRVGVDEDFRPRFAAKVLTLEVKETRDAHSLPMHTRIPGPIHYCAVQIAYPHANFGPRIPNLLSAVCGEGSFHAPGIPIVRLLDIEFPDRFLRDFAGPRFGVAGIREALQVFDRPIFLGVIKPNIGLSPEPFTELGEQSWLGGLDIAKDDEMLADTDWSPLAERTRLLGTARRAAEQATGAKKMYLANITDEVDRLLELHDLAVANGANALLLNTFPLGLSAVRLLSRHTQVPLFAHFPMQAALTRLPHYGIHSRVLTKLQRLAGCDAIIMPGFGERMLTTEIEVIDNANICLQPFGHLKPSLPVPGGSDWAGTLPGVYARLKTIDFGFVAGRGIFGHPMGPRGGAASIRQAWDAIVAESSLKTYAQQHPELAAALRQFG